MRRDFAGAHHHALRWDVRRYLRESAREFMLRRHDQPVQIELKRRLAEVLEEQVGDMPGRIVGRLMFRSMRFLKLARYSPGMRSLLDALYAERRALFGCFVILLGAALISATAMHLVEQHAQPQKFGTIPDAMWWAIVTLGTIGYGDVVPITPLGRLVAGVTIFGGLIMIALPVGIIATAFAEEIHRRDFVVTWGMVAQIGRAHV